MKFLIQKRLWAERPEQRLMERWGGFLKTAGCFRRLENDSDSPAFLEDFAGYKIRILYFSSQ